MKWILCFLIGFSFLYPQQSLHGQTTSFREAYHAIKNKEEVENFIKKYEKSTIKECKPYVASAIMRKAEFAFLPHNKLKYFNRGKEKLEAYIKQHPKCIDGRYVRAFTQSKVPKIVGYKKNIASDTIFIKKNIATSGLSKTYQNLILKNINNIK